MQYDLIYSAAGRVYQMCVKLSLMFIKRITTFKVKCVTLIYVLTNRKKIRYNLGCNGQRVTMLIAWAALHTKRTKLTYC